MKSEFSCCFEIGPKKNSIMDFTIHDAKYFEGLL